MNSNNNSRSKKFRVKEERNNNPVQLQHSEQANKYNQAGPSGVKKEEEKFFLEPEFKLDDILYRQRKKEKENMWNKFVSYVGSYSSWNGAHEEGGRGESFNLFTPAFKNNMKYDQIARPGNFAPKGSSYARLYNRRDKAETELERLSYMMYLDPMQIFILQPAVSKLDQVNFDKDFNNYLHNKYVHNRHASSAASSGVPSVVPSAESKKNPLGKYGYQITYPSIGPIFYNLLRNPPLLLHKNKYSFYNFIFPVLTLQYFVSVCNDNLHYFLNFSPKNIFLDNELLKMMDISFLKRRDGHELLKLIEDTLILGEVQFWMPVEISFLAKALKNETLKQKLKANDTENPSFLDADFFYHPQFYSSLQEFIRNGIRNGKCEKIIASLERIDYDERLDGDLWAFLNNKLKLIVEKGVDETELVKKIALDIYNYYMMYINSKLETYAFGQMLYTFTLMFNSSVRSIEQNLREKERTYLTHGQRVPENLKVALVKLENTQILLKVLVKYVMENMININYKKRKTLGEAFREIVFIFNYYDTNFRAEYDTFIEKNIRKISGENRNIFEYVRNQNISIINLKNFLKTNLQT